MLPNYSIGIGFGKTWFMPFSVAFLRYSGSTCPVTATISSSFPLACLISRLMMLDASYPSIKGIEQSVRISEQRLTSFSEMAFLMRFTACSPLQHTSTLTCSLSPRIYINPCMAKMLKTSSSTSIIRELEKLKGTTTDGSWSANKPICCIGYGKTD